MSCTCPYSFSGSASNQVCSNCMAATNAANNWCCNYCPTTPGNLCVPDGSPCSGGYQNSCGGGGGGDGSNGSSNSISISSSTSHIIYLAIGGLALIGFIWWLLVQRANRQWPFNCGTGYTPPSDAQQHGDYKPPQAMAVAQSSHAAANANANAPPYPSNVQLQKSAI